jgi:mxaJ protein
VSPQIDVPFLPQVFDIAMGVRREDKAFRDSLDVILEKEKPAITAILDTYGVPRT